MQHDAHVPVFLGIKCHFSLELRAFGKVRSNSSKARLGNALTHRLDNNINLQIGRYRFTVQAFRENEKCTYSHVRVRPHGNQAWPNNLVDNYGIRRPFMRPGW